MIINQSPKQNIEVGPSQPYNSTQPNQIQQIDISENPIKVEIATSKKRTPRESSASGKRTSKRK